MNSHQLFELTAYSFSIVVTAWIGGIIPLFYKKNHRVLHWFISLGAGVLLGAAFLHMIPEASEMIGKNVGIYVLGGFLMLFVLEKFIMTHPCPSEHCEFHRVGLSAFLGLSLHSLVTGIALGTGVMVPKLGLVVFLAIILHKLPASLSLTSLFIKENYSTKKLFVYLTAFSLMVPLGALITYLFLQQTSVKTIGALTAFSAGTFLHVAADDLLPEVHQHSHDKYSRLFVFGIGILTTWLVTLLE
ncbi:zinc/iron permease [Caldithrix abyssi DSM 13497]|uniref:Zinc and cadmium transporter n=1 Tax=Caldithrix abyssi DSM 13497 TaxID=880073 RepID=H1XYT4_CALAY|nr:ZIP family metal transporter [Caldithrix abyssi]APF20532.1 zinc and cadmium transporter [Caldithrix abyssi DSM 13497]EHO40953.1 zinc/iron permease [Caldithrix abyssi DSM 13497]